MPNEVWHEITYPFLNFNDCAFHVWKVCRGGHVIFKDFNNISLQILASYLPTNSNFSMVHPALWGGWREEPRKQTS